MHAAILTSWYPSNKDPLYGIFVKTQAKELSQHMDVDVLIIKRGLISATNTVQDEKLTIQEKSCFYLPNINEYFLQKWAHQYYLHFKLLHEKHNYQIIHCHDHYAAYAGWYINTKIDIPYVVTIHNSSILQLTLAKWKQDYLPKVLDSASEVISVSNSLADVLKDKFTSNKISVVPNYINTDLFRIYEKGKKVLPFQFIYVGDFNENKGVIELIHSFAKVKHDNVRLLLIGNGPLSSKVKSDIKLLDLEEKVKVVDSMENDKLPAIYNESHAYVSLSKRETFGITVLEAMSCGLPIIYTQSGGPEQIVQKASSMITSKTDTLAIALTMEEMIDLYPSINKEKIRQHVLDNFSSDSMIKQLINIYKRNTKNES